MSRSPLWVCTNLAPGLLQIEKFFELNLAVAHGLQTYSNMHLLVFLCHLHLLLNINFQAINDSHCPVLAAFGVGVPDTSRSGVSPRQTDVVIDTTHSVRRVGPPNTSMVLGYPLEMRVTEPIESRHEQAISIMVDLG